MENTLPLVLEQTYENFGGLIKIVITLLSSIGIVAIGYFIFQIVTFLQRKKQEKKIDKILFDLRLIKNKLKIKN
jgi:hypothetical protein